MGTGLQFATLTVTPVCEETKKMKKFISRYKDRLCWHNLSYNLDIPWSLELLEEFHNLWNWSALTYNNDLWKKVFDPYLDDEFVENVVKEINCRYEKVSEESNLPSHYKVVVERG